MSQEPKKIDRRKFIYAGLGAVAVAAIGVAAYFATRPPERVVETVVQTQTVEKERVITQTIEKPVTMVTTVAGTPTTIVQTTREVITQTQTIEVTPTPTFKPGVLRIWQLSHAAVTDKQKWEAIYSKFEKETGIKVELSLFGADDLVSKLTSTFEAGAVGNYPDLINAAWATNQIWSVRGYLEPLDDVVDWLKSSYGGDVIPILLDSVYWPGPGGDRKFYAAPVGYTVQGIFWRKDILDKAGVKTEDLLDFPSFDKSLYIIRDKIKELGLNMSVASIQISALGSTDSTYGTWSLFNILSGVPPVDPKTLKVQLDDTPEHFQALVNVVETFARWYKDGILIQSSLVDAGVDNNLHYINGKVVMTPNGIASIYAVMVDRNTPHLKDTITLPWPGNKEKNVKPAAVIDPRFVMVPAGLPKDRIDMAKGFIKWFLKQENYTEWFGDKGGFGWFDAPLYWSLLNKEPYLSHPVWKGVRDAVVEGGFPPIDLFRPSFGALRPRPPTIEISQYILGSYTKAEDAAKAIVNRIKSLITLYDKGLP